MVLGSVGSPTARGAGVAAESFDHLIEDDRWTTARVGAVQIWPEWKDQVEPMQPTAPAMSASSKTRQAPLPTELEEEPLHGGGPRLGDPDPDVGGAGEETMSTSGESPGRRPGRGSEAVTRLTTPGGKPTSSRIRTSSMTARGSWGAGLTTTVFPMARAGATFPAMLTMGKL